MCTLQRKTRGVVYSGRAAFSREGPSHRHAQSGNQRDDGMSAAQTGSIISSVLKLQHHEHLRPPSAAARRTGSPLLLSQHLITGSAGGNERFRVSVHVCARAEQLADSSLARPAAGWRHNAALFPAGPVPLLSPCAAHLLPSPFTSDLICSIGRSPHPP